MGKVNKKHCVSTDEHAQLFFLQITAFVRQTLVLALIALEGHWQYFGHKKVTTEFFTICF